MRHLDLFAGIGGFSLAARWMGWETIAWVEINPFCQQILRKHFPKAKGYDDIKQFDGAKYRGAVDIITGGFPCQPFSTAGKRKGTKDDRYLWPEMLRVIREVQPAYIVGENVYGLVNWSGGLVFEQVCADLENEGYQVQPVILPACAVDAPHRRDRVWFVAYSKSNNDRGTERKFHQANGRQNGELLSALGSAGEGLCCEGTTTYACGDGHKRRRLGKDQSAQGEDEGEGLQRERVRDNPERTGAARNAAHASRDRHKGGGNTGNQTSENDEIETRYKATGAFFRQWQDFPTQPPLRDGNDGLPSNMVRSAIQAGGNAIVPQVAYEIFKAIERVNN